MIGGWSGRCVVCGGGGWSRVPPHLRGNYSKIYVAYGSGGGSSEAGRQPTMAQQQHEGGQPTRRWNNGNGMINNYCINNSNRRMTGSQRIADIIREGDQPGVRK
jgi:hypothetical protein